MGALPPTAVDAKTLEDLFEFAASVAGTTADRAAFNSFTRELLVIQGTREKRCSQILLRQERALLKEHAQP